MDRPSFQNEMEELKLTVYQMASLARQSLDRSYQAYLNRDEALARDVIAGDRKINQLEVDIDRRALRLLALKQPLANDLRLIIGIMQTSYDLERVADQCANIARHTLSLCQYPPLEKPPALEALMDISKKMFNLALTAFRDMDSKVARGIEPLDDLADGHHLQVLKWVIETMANGPANGLNAGVPRMDRAIQTVNISNSLERIADHATNISEHVVFIAEGISIKHQDSDC